LEYASFLKLIFLKFLLFYCKTLFSY